MFMYITMNVQPTRESHDQVSVGLIGYTAFTQIRMQNQIFGPKAPPWIRRFPLGVDQSIDEHTDENINAQIILLNDACVPKL